MTTGPDRQGADAHLRAGWPSVFASASVSILASASSLAPASALASAEYILCSANWPQLGPRKLSPILDEDDFQSYGPKVFADDVQRLSKLFGAKSWEHRVVRASEEEVECLRRQDSTVKCVSSLQSAEKQKQQHDQTKCRTERRKRAKANRGVRYANFLQERQSHGRAEVEVQAQAQGEIKFRIPASAAVEMHSERRVQNELDQQQLRAMKKKRFEEWMVRRAAQAGLQQARVELHGTIGAGGEKKLRRGTEREKVEDQDRRVKRTRSRGRCCVVDQYGPGKLHAGVGGVAWIGTCASCWFVRRWTS